MGLAHSESSGNGEAKRNRQREPRQKAVPGSCTPHLGNDIPVLGVNLSNGSQLAQTGEDLVELKEK